MKEKIVVLNSGGFDSICLINHVVNTLEEGNEVHSLHFKYGNINKSQETKCVKRVCKKLDVKNHIVKLPKFKWTEGEFYNTNYDVKTQYLEYRNLVFLSYALSFAESIGATRIYLAVLKSHHGYKDTSPKFIDNFNNIARQSGVTVIAPFADYDKQDLTQYVLKYGIKKNEYFSCDVPILRRFRCGYCPDCEALNEIEERIKIDIPVKKYILTGDLKDPEFISLEKNSQIQEIRFLLNNDCQLKCKHCFYGFTDTVSPILSKEVLYSALKESYKLGVRHIHFSGKEPLFNGDIFWYTSRMRKELPEMTWSVVTNGINIPKYIEQLYYEKCERVFLSVDDVLDTNGVRTNHTTERALDSLAKTNIPVEIFIDLHSNNKDCISDIIKSLSDKYGDIIKKYYVRTIKNIGNAKDFSLLTSDDLNGVYEQMKQVCSSDYDLSFNIGIEYLPVISGSTLDTDIKHNDLNFSDVFGENFTVYIEKFCNRYQTQVTLTPDGYLLGCASEVSVPRYDLISVGNIKDNTMKELFSKGKSKLISCQKERCFECSFLQETY